MEQHKRVLVVDDESEIRDLLTSVLRHHGLIVDEAADGRAAVEALAANRYSVVLLDLLMPVSDGFAVLETLRRNEDGQPLPIVLVITGADRRTVEQVDPRFVHGVVRKPFDPLEIAGVVVACTEVRGRSTFETMAIAMLSGAPLLAWLSGKM